MFYPNSMNIYCLLFFIIGSFIVGSSIGTQQNYVLSGQLFLNGKPALGTIVGGDKIAYEVLLYHDGKSFGKGFTNKEGKFVIFVKDVVMKKDNKMIEILIDSKTMEIDSMNRFLNDPNFYPERVYHGNQGSSRIVHLKMEFDKFFWQKVDNKKLNELETLTKMHEESFWNGKLINDALPAKIGNKIALNDLGNKCYSVKNNEYDLGVFGDHDGKTKQCSMQQS